MRGGANGRHKGPYVKRAPRHAYTLPLVAWDESDPAPKGAEATAGLIPQRLLDPPLDGSGDRCCCRCRCLCCVSPCQRGAPERSCLRSPRRYSGGVMATPPSSRLRTSCAREDKVFSRVFLFSLLTLKPTSKGREAEQRRNKGKGGGGGEEEVGGRGG